MPIQELPKLEEAVLQYIQKQQKPITITDLSDKMTSLKAKGVTSSDLRFVVGELEHRGKIKFSEGWRLVPVSS